MRRQAKREGAERSRPGTFGQALSEVPHTAPTPLATAVAHGLRTLGVRTAYGIGGAAIARFAAGCADAEIEVAATRHESGAAFIAAEHSIATGDPVAVFTTTGPGWANALTGLCTAAWEGARVIAVLGGTAHDRLGQNAFQETGPGVLDLSRWLPEGFAHHTAVIERGAHLTKSLRAISQGLHRPDGYLAVLQLPLHAQSTDTPRPVALLGEAPRYQPSPAQVSEVCRAIDGRRLALWVGHGAQGAEAEIAELAARTGAVVACSPRGKGVVDASNPQHTGVLGFAAKPDARARFAAAAPEIMLVLGSRLGEFATTWNPELVPPHGLIHVDVNPAVFNAAYPDADALCVTAAVKPLVAALNARLDGGAAVCTPCVVPPAVQAPAYQGSNGHVHPGALMAAVQRVVLDGSDALVLAEAGNAFAWATHALAFRTPRYRMSSSFGAMGHATCGVVGAALGHDGGAVALVGDGAMLMNNELTTALATGAKATWIVLDDQAYGMIQHGMQAIEVQPVGTAIPVVDFVAWATAQGVPARRVETADTLDETLRWALSQDGPSVVSVRIDDAVPPPFGARNAVITKDDPNDAPLHDEDARTSDNTPAGDTHADTQADDRQRWIG